MKYKDYYDEKYIIELSNKIHAVRPAFDASKLRQILSGKLEDKELFARLDCITDALAETMGGDYANNIHSFTQLLGEELPKLNL